MSVTPADGFVIMLNCSEVGIPMGQLELVHSLANGAQGGFRDRLTAQRDELMASRDLILGKLDDVDQRLHRSRLPEPTRPDSYPQYQLWNQAIQTAVGDATGPASTAGGCAALGRVIGDLLQNVSMHIVVRYLREVAPDQPRLTMMDTHLLSVREQLAEQVSGVAKFPTLLEALRAPAEACALVARTLVSIAAETSPDTVTATLRVAFHQLAGEVGMMRRVVAGPEMN